MVFFTILITSIFIPFPCLSIKIVTYVVRAVAWREFAFSFFFFSQLFARFDKQPVLQVTVIVAVVVTVVYSYFFLLVAVKSNNERLCTIEQKENVVGRAAKRNSVYKSIDNIIFFSSIWKISRCKKYLVLPNMALRWKKNTRLRPSGCAVSRVFQW